MIIVMLKELLNDLTEIDDVLFIVKSNGVVSEIRSNGLKLFQRESWITIGENDGPCHMHINSELLSIAKFIVEEKPDRVSYSVRFFDDNDERVLACFITKMYDSGKNLIHTRKKLYDDLFEKYGSQKILEFKNKES